MGREVRKVALFGGTFDPPHAGHLKIAECARSACGLERVVFLPCRQSPHKLEVERPGDMRETARRKAGLALDATDNDFALASEGAYGPSPEMPNRRPRIAFI